MEEILNISITLIDDAKIALKELDRENYQKAREFIDKLISLSEQELRLILASLQISEDKIFFFDIKKKAKEIFEVTKLAKRYLEEGKITKTRRLLKLIVALEKEVIKQKRYLGDEIISASKVTAEAAIIIFIRYNIDPYVQYFGHQIDMLDYKIMHFDEYLKHKLESLFGKKSEEGKKSMTVTTKKLYEKYTALTEHPRFIPHLSKNEPYAYILSDILYLGILTIFVSIIIFKNIPSYIRTKVETRKIKRIYSILNSRFSKEVEVLR